MERRKVKLGEICNVNARSIQKDSCEGDIQYLDTSNLAEGTISQLQEIAIARAPSRAQRLVSDETILFSMVRPNQKHYGILSTPPENMVVSTGFATLDVKDKTHYCPAYVYYLLTQESVVNYLQTLAEGSVSAYPSINPSDIANLSFTIPEYAVQRRIGKLLSDIDRKIALNRRMNATFEAMARQLYDYWFLQFDFPDAHSKPYKSSGGKMTWNNKLKRDIPEGWSVIPLHDGAEVQYGFPFSTELFVESETGYPVVRIRDILDGTTSAFTTEVPDVKYQILKGDVIVGMDGNFHMNFWHVDTTFLNQRCVRLRAKNNSAISAMQIYFDINPYIKAKELNAKGSTVAHLSDKDIKSLYLIKPCDSKAFDPRVPFDAILSNIISCRVNISTLTRLRTTLLPLLMNGQVSVS